MSENRGMSANEIIEGANRFLVEIQTLIPSLQCTTLLSSSGKRWVLPGLNGLKLNSDATFMDTSSMGFVVVI